MKEAKFRIAQMDCPTEEKLIRRRLERVDGIAGLEFNLKQRELTLKHRLDDTGSIVAALSRIVHGVAT
jgi:Zn2+/Cd2+-exporting ATPase